FVAELGAVGAGAENGHRGLGHATPSLQRNRDFESPALARRLLARALVAASVQRLRLALRGVPVLPGADVVVEVHIGSQAGECEQYRAVLDLVLLHFDTAAAKAETASATAGARAKGGRSLARLPLLNVKSMRRYQGIDQRSDGRGIFHLVQA